MPSGTPLPAPPNVAGLDFKGPSQPQWFYFILAAPRLPPGPDPVALGPLHTWAQVNHSSTHSTFPCQCFIPCQTPNPSVQAGLAGVFGCQKQPQPSWPWLNTGESPGRLCLTLPALMAAPFPAEKNPAISSQLCHETIPILGQRLPQAQLQPVPTGEAKPTAGARRAPAQHQHQEQFRSILTPQPTRAGAQSPSWPPAKLRWGEWSCRRGSTNPGQAQAPQSCSRL